MNEIYNFKNETIREDTVGVKKYDRGLEMLISQCELLGNTLNALPYCSVISLFKLLQQDLTPNLNDKIPFKMTYYVLHLNSRMVLH